MMAKSLPLFSTNVDGSLAENAPLMIHTRLAEMLSFSVRITDPKRLTELHNMRIAAKRLRYTFEIFAPVFIESGEQAYTWMHDSVRSIQEKIGDIHDCDVRIERMKCYSTEHGKKHPEVRAGLDIIIAREIERRKGLYRDFLIFWKDLCEEQQFPGKVLLQLVQLGYPSAIGVLRDDGRTITITDD